MNPSPEDVPPPADWAHDEDDKGFWTRFKEAIAGPASPEPEAEAPPPPDPEPEPAPAAEPRPRRIKRTVFDGGHKPTSRRTRLRRLSDQKRESLALVVGAEVEKVIVEKIQPRDEEMGKVAEGFGALNAVLSKIPESAGAQVEALGGQLTVLNGVRGELELHRAQRERVIGGLDRLEKAMALLVEKQKEQERLAQERALEDRRLQAEEAERFEKNMAFFAARVHEQSSAIMSAQEVNAQSFRATHRAVLNAFEDAQARALSEIERREAERERRMAQAEKEREERGRARAAKARRSRRLAAVAGAFVLALLGGVGFFVFSLDEQRDVVARDADERADRALDLIRTRTATAPVVSSTTLPAGFTK